MSARFRNPFNHAIRERIPCCIAISCAMLLAGCGTMVPLSDSQLNDAATVLPSSQASSESQAELMGRIDRVLDAGRDRRILADDVNAAWQVIHGAVCYGKELQLTTRDGRRVLALDYLFHGGELRGWELKQGENLPNSDRIGLAAKLEPGSYIGQGHPDQWIGYFALAGVPSDEPIEFAGKQFQLIDWIRQSQRDVSSNRLQEFSWTLMALCTYLPDEPTWRAVDGETWSWERLVEAELQFDLHESACGGAHRLVGLAKAVQAKRRAALPDSPVWQAAEQVVSESLEAARTMRSSDGSLSSNYFRRPGVTRNLTAALAGGGHVFEFVAVAADDRTLAEPWVAQAAERLTTLLESTDQVDMDCGALYHGLNGLRIYRSRMGKLPVISDRAD
ncbi:MAG: hypothetical protein U0892_04765 [Pirellulales bacterium]